MRHGHTEQQTPPSRRTDPENEAALESIKANFGFLEPEGARSAIASRSGTTRPRRGPAKPTSIGRLCSRSSEGVSRRSEPQAMQPTVVPVENPTLNRRSRAEVMRHFRCKHGPKASCHRKERPLFLPGLGKRRLPIRRLPSKVCATPDFVRTIAHGRVAAVNCTR